MVRRAAAGVALGLALAVGAPTAWAVTRPAPSAGTPVSEALAAAPTTAPPSSTTPAGSALPPVPTRDAAPGAAPEARPAPVRLAVPALGVDTTVDPVGVEDDGQMTIPAEVDRVGWYRFGPVPGAAGSAVLAGHVDSREQGLGAMAPLREAEPGQQIEVTDAAGAVTRWQVTSRELVSKQEVPLAELFGRTGDPRLVLVTCGGPFLPELRSYRDNVVVVATPLP
ncbi:class F sortase [Modestobacter sp. SYSU DS0875]